MGAGTGASMARLRATGPTGSTPGSPGLGPTGTPVLSGIPGAVGARLRGRTGSNVAASHLPSESMLASLPALEPTLSSRQSTSVLSDAAMQSMDVVALAGYSNHTMMDVLRTAVLRLLVVEVRSKRLGQL